MANLLLVMKRPGNVRVLRQAVEPLGYTVSGITSNAELESVLAEQPQACVGLVDVSGFGALAWEMCETLRRHEVRFIVLSEPRGTRAANQALEYGAASILQKPITKRALLQLLQGLS